MRQDRVFSKALLDIFEKVGFLKLKEKQQRQFQAHPLFGSTKQAPYVDVSLDEDCLQTCKPVKPQSPEPLNPKP